MKITVKDTTNELKHPYVKKEQEQQKEINLTRWGMNVRKITHPEASNTIK